MLPRPKIVHGLRELSSAIRVQRVAWPPTGYTAEILRLYILYPHSDPYFKSLGLGVEEMAAYRFLQLAKGKGHLFLALHKRRVCGLLHLISKPWASAMLNRHVWSIDQAVAAPDAPADTLPSLLSFGLAEIQEPVEFISTDIPASDVAAIHGLRSFGFRAVVDQKVAVIHKQAVPDPENPLIKIGPLKQRHLAAVSRIARDNHQCSRFSRVQDFNPVDVAAFQSLQISNFAEEQACTILVAENCAGRVLGFIGVATEDDAVEYTSRRLARVEHVGTRKNLRPHRLEKLLHRFALSFLFRHGTETVSINIPMNHPDAARTLDLLRRIGYRTAATHLVMHCGLRNLAHGVREMQRQTSKPKPAGRTAPRINRNRPGSADGPSKRVYRVV